MKRLFLCRMCLMVSLFYGPLVEAHNPNEIGYNFEVNKTKQELLIHLTPKAAVDLIQYLKPELKQKSAIRLDDYLSDFESYFDKTITFSLEGHRVDLQLIESHLYDHDATLRFKMNTEVNDYSGFSLTVISFTEIYKRIKNIVLVNMNGKTFRYGLDEDKTRCAISPMDWANKTYSGFLHYLISIIILILFGFIMFRIGKT